MAIVSLPTDLDRFATAAIAEGRYRNFSDLVAAAVRLLQRQDQARAELRAAVLAAEEEPKRDDDRPVGPSRKSDRSSGR